jgi:hypothetical protein
MALSAQDKILYVANKLGLSSLNLMQGSTGAVYDVDTDISGQIFTSASRHQNPSITNLTQNEFEVNEALLVENIAFYVKNASGQILNFQEQYGSNAVIVFDLVIGNKRVMKSTPVFASGSPYTFANTGNVASLNGETTLQALIPRHQVFLEGAGVLIPPQVQWYVDYRVFNVVTGATITPTDAKTIGCYLFGTRVLLNFNTSI